jgi:hypothetical protein
MEMEKQQLIGFQISERLEMTAVRLLALAPTGRATTIFIAST